MSTITCTTLHQLAYLCAEFVRAGVQFRADADLLTITLTGGF